MKLRPDYCGALGKAIFTIYEIDNTKYTGNIDFKIRDETGYSMPGLGTDILFSNRFEFNLI